MSRSAAIISIWRSPSDPLTGLPYASDVRKSSVQEKGEGGGGEGGGGVGGGEGGGEGPETARTETVGEATLSTVTFSARDKKAVMLLDRSCTQAVTSVAFWYSTT